MRLLTRIPAALVVLLLLALQGLTQSHSAFPVDIVPGPAPQPVTADGHVHLLYELHLTNLSASPIEILGLEVVGDNGPTPLARYRGEELEKLLVAIGPSDGEGKLRAIRGGRSVLIFLDLTLDSAARVPTALHHQFSLSIQRKKDGTGGNIENTVNGPEVAVVQESATLLRAPLRGPRWLAANGLSNADHRRSYIPVDGRVLIAQRFAIDWVQLGPDGRFSHDEANANSNFYAYGADVLAVADGRISDLKDGVPENSGSNEQRALPITLETIAGNYIILELGPKRFALYAHLQPGSLRVKLGDRVKAGDVLARLGNSGNSDAPHLHFHLMDANSPLGAEGLPYELDSFTQLAVIDDPAVLDKGEAWQPKTPPAPVLHRREFPVDNALLTFP